MRLFVAAKLTQETISALRRVQSKLESKIDRGLSIVAPEILHLTLAFLGEVDSNKLDLLWELLTETAAESSVFNYRVESLGMFPSEGLPRVIWAGIGDGFAEFRSLMQVTADQLRAAEFTIEDRDPHPHITLARVKDWQIAAQVKALVSQMELGSTEIQCSEFSLFSSELNPRGAVHRELKAFRLVGC